DVFYFPDSFKKTGTFTELNASHLMMRTEALTKFNGENIHKKIVVTYPEALFEKVVNSRILSENLIQLKVGEQLNVDKLMNDFVQLGFKREDFVYEPGQFAMRGGILDIYSFGNEHPYRIELFGNEVDSIRLFNPETQLSERKLLQVSIIPNVETKFETGEKISLLDYLPGNTVIWAKDFDFTLGRLGKMETELPEVIELSDVAIDHEEAWVKQLTKDDFETTEEWLPRLRQRHLLEWYNNSLPRLAGDELTANLQFATDEQPVFNRQFNLLIDDLQ